VFQPAPESWLAPPQAHPQATRGHHTARRRARKPIRRLSHRSLWGRVPYLLCPHLGLDKDKMGTWTYGIRCRLATSSRTGIRTSRGSRSRIRIRTRTRHIRPRRQRQEDLARGPCTESLSASLHLLPFLLFFSSSVLYNILL